MTDIELQAIRKMTDNASILLWITGGALLRAQRPKFSLVLGLARSLMLERPSLKIPVLDDRRKSSDNVLSVLRQIIHRGKSDLGYRQYNDTLYNSRFVLDLPINKLFRQTQDAKIVLRSLGEAGHCRLAMKSAEQMNSIYFQQQPQFNSQIPSQFLEVKVKVVGLNAKVSVYGKLGDFTDMRAATLRTSTLWAIDLTQKPRPVL